MIRYVLAVLITVALLALSVPAMDYGAAVTSEQQVEGEIATIEEAARSLVEQERLPPRGVDGPRRTVTVTFPDQSMTSDRAKYIHFERIEGAGITRVTFQVVGRGPSYVQIDAPIIAEDGGSVELGGKPGEQTLHLTLERDDNDEPVVVLGRGPT